MTPPIPFFSINQKIELKVGAENYYKALIKGLQFIPLDYSATEYLDWDILYLELMKMVKPMNGDGLPNQS
jgi:hypothetical protein